MKKICMVVQDRKVKGGIAAVVDGYYGSKLEENYQISYVESYKDGGKFQKLWKALGGYGNFTKELILNRPDLVHIHSSFGPSFYRKIPFIILSGMFRIPVVNHIHGADFEEFYIKASEKKKNLIKKIYSKCTAFIVLSDEWRQKISQIVPEEKITIIENYSILQEKAAKKRANRKCNHKVLFLGALGERKGCFDIPEVVDLVAKKIPDVKFILAGEGTPADERQIKKELLNKNLAKNVAFPGWVRGKEKERLLNDADVFFLPSYNEGMPMSVLDAMGYGLPVVSTNVGGIPKIVKNNCNGFCCEPGEIMAFSDAIVDLLLNEEKRITMGNESIRIVRDQYSFELHLQKLMDLYGELLNV